MLPGGWRPAPGASNEKRNILNTNDMSAIQSTLLELPLPSPEPRPRLVDVPEAVPGVYEEITRLREALSHSTNHRIVTARELIRSRDHVRVERLATTVEPLDRLLGGGLTKGKLVEITARRSTGRFSLVLASLAAVTSTGDAAAVIDLGDHLDPESAAHAGADLSRLLWVRPESTRDAVVAAEMVIATGFPLVVLDLGLRFRGRRVYDAAWVRLARAAEEHDAALLVTSPFPVSGTAADSLVAMDESRPKWQGRGRTPRILVGLTSRMTVEKQRGAAPGGRGEMGVSSSNSIKGVWNAEC